MSQPATEILSRNAHRILLKNALKDLLAMHDIIEAGYVTLPKDDVHHLQVATKSLVSILYPAAMDKDVIKRIHIPAEPELKKLGEKI